MQTFELSVTRENSDTEWKIRLQSYSREDAIKAAIVNRYIVKTVRLIEDEHESRVYRWLRGAAIVCRVLSWICVVLCTMSIISALTISRRNQPELETNFTSLLLSLGGVTLSYLIEGFGLLVRNSK